MSKDLYSIIGVDKSSSKAEIKKAYHKLARKYHPDVNKDNPSAAEKFKEASAAYDILGDDEKRKKYDNNEIDADGKPTAYGAGFGSGFGSGGYGGNPFGGGSGGAEFDFSSIFTDDIFSAFSGGNSRGGFGSNARRARKGEDVAYNMNLDFLSAAKGMEQQVTIGGKGVNVKVPAGSTNGQTLRLKGLGKTGHFGGANGDVLITLNIGAHPYFAIDGANVLMDLAISVKEAILGAKIIVPTIDGQVAVKVPAYANSGDKLRLKGKGIKSNKAIGDQIMTLKIMTPKKKNQELENVLASIADEEVRSF